MSANKEKPHVQVLPEDDANRQIANGFKLGLDWPVQRQFRILGPAGGWITVLDAFEREHIRELETYQKRFLVLLIDFDGRFEERITYATNKIPPVLKDRVFIIGALYNPERLKSAGHGSFEDIGRKLAVDCREGTRLTWNHELLHRNAAELSRLNQHIRPIVFA